MSLWDLVTRKNKNNNDEADRIENQKILVKDIEVISKRIVCYETKENVKEFTEILKSIIRITETKQQILQVRTFFSTICKDMYVQIKNYIRYQDSYKTEEVNVQLNKIKIIIKQMLEIAKNVYKEQINSMEISIDIALKQLEKIKDYGM